MAKLTEAISILLLICTGYGPVQGFRSLDQLDQCKHLKAPENGLMHCFRFMSSPLKVTFGIYKRERKTNNYRCQFTCQDGYTLIGSPVLDCPIDKFSNIPICQQDLGRSLDKIANGLHGECGEPAIPPVFPPIDVVGGSKAKKGSYPWIVQLRTASLSFQFCAGTLISNSWVLSAAHCLRTETPGSVSIGLGYYQKDGIGDEGQIVDADIAEIFVHEGYNTTSFANDIALVKLREAVDVTDYISPACLPDGSILDDCKQGEKLIITGWGNTQGTAPEPDYLQQARVQYIDSEICNRPEWYDNRVLSGMFCAGYKDGGVDTCQGDSGGPVICKANDDTYKVHGITSWGYGCAEEKHPGIYTRVYYYREWINSIMANI